MYIFCANKDILMQLAHWQSHQYANAINLLILQPFVIQVYVSRETLELIQYKYFVWPAHILPLRRKQILWPP